MKTGLLTGTALAVVWAAAGQAPAAEWNVAVGGYMEQYVAYANSDVDNASGEEYGGVDSKQDAEISFMASIELDNGISFGAQVELEALTTSDQIDESFMFIDSSYGRLELGARPSAGYMMHYAAPDVTFVNVNSGSMTAFVPFSGTAAGLGTGAEVFYGTLGTTYIENAASSNVQRLTYYSPRFMGFQVGGSYARDNLEDSNAQVNKDGFSQSDIFDLGVNYVETLGDIDVALSARWGMAGDDTPGVGRPVVWGAGANIAYSGVTIGGSFAEQNDTPLQDGQAYDAGISYETGPWGFSFTYMHGENADDEAPVAGADEKLSQYLIGVSYALAEGVTLNGFGAYIDFDEDVGDAGGPGDDVDGFVIGSGIKIEF